MLTEDSISHLCDTERPLIVTDQWMYHTRLYKAASYVKTCDCLDLIQLNSFGCGLDAITGDEMREVYANLFVFRGKIVACDISSADPTGFVIPLTRVDRDRLK